MIVETMNNQRSDDKATDIESKETATPGNDNASFDNEANNNSNNTDNTDNTDNNDTDGASSMNDNISDSCDMGSDTDMNEAIDEAGAQSSNEDRFASDGDESSSPDPIAALQEELAAVHDRYLRLAAEYENFRKRSAKEREGIYADAGADVLMRLLPIYDNLERALKTECSDDAFYKGVEMTMTQFTEILESIGVVQIPAVGEPFDPNRHNAVMSIENPELGEKIVAEEFQKGFMIGDRVIRFSTVVVAN